MHGGQSRERLQLFVPNLYDALVCEREFKSEYLERQIYERSLESEPFIVKLIENKSDLSKLTLYHLKKRGHLDVLVNQEFHCEVSTRRIAC